MYQFFSIADCQSNAGQLFNPLHAKPERSTTDYLNCSFHTLFRGSIGWLKSPERRLFSVNLE